MITDKPGNQADAKKIIGALLEGCSRVLDLGCGERHFTKHLPDTVWVDLDPKHATDPRVLVMDILETPAAFRRMHFDAALMTDVIEHLTKPDGQKLLANLEPLCDRIVIFTPLGELSMSPELHSSPHHHRCGWMPEELEEIGYTTWSWPTFHRFPTSTHGAFYAWKFIGSRQPTPEDILAASGIDV